MEIEPGQLWLNRYRIVERLGYGGMGEVWSARDEALDRMVAVKALARHLVANEDARQRFRREAQLAGSLSHDHVVTIHDAGTAGDAMVLVMELVEGGNLAVRLRAGGALRLPEAVRIAGEVLGGLSAAHDAGLVHRDVKPANVMFTSTGAVKLTDFGIARLAATETTRTSEVYGSAPYIAPERADGHPAVPASDVYAVGCVFYEMLTGTSPFVGETPAVTIARHLKYHPPLPSSLNPDVPPALDAVVMRSLAKDPLDRYPHAGAMLEDLQHALERGEVAPATVALQRPLRMAERRLARADATATITPTRPAPRSTVWVAAATGLLMLLVLAATLRP